MRFSDRAIDLGCIAAELKHLFYLLCGDQLASEQYIQHFYNSYADHLSIGGDKFAILTERSRFFMGCFELRIGRNAGLDVEYRGRLIEEAEICLWI